VDFCTATLGEKKANVNSIFAKIVSPIAHSFCDTFSLMPKLTLPVRIAAGSILLLSLAHIAFWGMLAFSARANLPETFPYNYFFPILGLLSAAGLFGAVVAAGLLRARHWARVAALVLAALIAFLCVFAVLALVVMAFGLLSMGLGIEIPQKSELIRVALFYFFIFSLALWWIVLFSRKSVVAQFSPSASASAQITPTKRLCPPPIALLAWLMIISSGLSALSWPLILSRIPAMLFTHVFSSGASKWIWAANIVLFLVCAIGLLKLQRWSYTGAIALHVFWLVSLLFTQLSPNYEQYMNKCLNALELSQAYPMLANLRFPQWASALATAIPTALLIAGLFYYRRAFLKAAAEAGH
jgi:hypothetical protein